MLKLTPRGVEAVPLGCLASCKKYLVGCSSGTRMHLASRGYWCWNIFNVADRRERRSWALQMAPFVAIVGCSSVVYGMPSSDVIQPVVMSWIRASRAERMLQEP